MIVPLAMLVQEHLETPGIFVPGSEWVLGFFEAFQIAARYDLKGELLRRPLQQELSGTDTRVPSLGTAFTSRHSVSQTGTAFVLNSCSMGTAFSGQHIV